MMYSDLPTVDHAVDRAGFVRVDGKRVLAQPGEYLRYRSCDLLTCQRCGRRAIAHALRVVCEPDDRIGTRYFHALLDVPTVDHCIDCVERERGGQT